MKTEKPDFNEWIKTESGAVATDITTLSGQEYLTNRLFWAFDAGRDCVWSQYLELRSRVSELERENERLGKIILEEPFQKIERLEKEVETLRAILSKLMESFGKGEPDPKCDC